MLTHLGDSFYDIRFGLMKDQLEDDFRSHGIELTADLRLEINRAIRSKDVKPAVSEQLKWDRIEKPILKCIRKKKYISYENTDYDNNKPYEIRCPEITAFTTNAGLLLRAVVCSEAYSATYDDDLCCRDFDVLDELEVTKFKILEGSSEIKNVETYTEHTGPKNTDIVLKSWSPNVIYLKKPIAITPGIIYTISLKLRGDSVDGQLYTNFELKGTEVNDGITVKFSNDAEVSGTIRNFIYGLHFSKL